MKKVLERLRRLRPDRSIDEKSRKGKLSIDEQLAKQI